MQDDGKEDAKRPELLFSIDAVDFSSICGIIMLCLRDRVEFAEES